MFTLKMAATESKVVPNWNPYKEMPYTYFSASKLDPELVCELQDRGSDVHYEEAVNEAVAKAERQFETGGVGDLQEAIDEALAELDSWEDVEPVHQGEHEGVTYQTTWLGGALLVCVIDSPHSGKFAKCSPCLPGALDGDTPGDYEGFDVPEDWKFKD